MINDREKSEEDRAVRNGEPVFSVPRKCLSPVPRVGGGRGGGRELASGRERRKHAAGSDLSTTPGPRNLATDRPPSTPPPRQGGHAEYAGKTYLRCFESACTFYCAAKPRGSGVSLGRDRFVPGPQWRDYGGAREC